MIGGRFVYTRTEVCSGFVIMEPDNIISSANYIRNEWGISY